MELLLSFCDINVLSIIINFKNNKKKKYKLINRFNVIF